MDFWEITSGIASVLNASWFDNGYMFGVSLQGRLNNFSRSIREAGLGSILREGWDGLRRASLPHFAGSFRTPSGVPIFQPSLMKSSSSSRARGGGDAGSQTPRCSVACLRRYGKNR